MKKIEVGDCVVVARVTDNLWCDEFKHVIGNVGYVTRVRHEADYDEVSEPGEPPYYQIKFLNQNLGHQDETWWDATEVEKVT